jgi:hypothetical protein
MYDRLNEFDLINEIKKHDGIVMGYSAWAMIQLSEYHISPDNDYPVFCYKSELNFIGSFGIEAHFQDTEIQKIYIERFKTDKKKPVYAIGDYGAVIVSGSEIQVIGDVKYYLLK